MKKLLTTLCLLFATTVAIVSFLAASTVFGQEKKTADVNRSGSPAMITIEVHEGTQLAFDISPDGRTIVFDLLGQLWLLPASGGEATPLTNAVRDTAEDLDPSFSPDGKWIVFRADRPGGKGLWIISRAGGEARRLTDEDDVSASWASNAREIAFVRKNAIHILDIQTGTVTPVQIDGLPSRAVRDPVWSPDGSRIAFINAFSWGRIWEVERSGGKAVPLTAEDVKALKLVYSPDGRRLVFFRRDSVRLVQLWMQERSGGPAQKLTNHPDTTPLRARWSRDGSAILYSADGRLWRIAAEVGAPQEIPFTAKLSFLRQRARLKPIRFPLRGVKLPARGHMGLSLSPDGKRIAMIALGKLWVFPIGSQPTSVAPMPPDAAGLSWSPDGREVAWSAGPGGAEDLFATDVETGKTRLLTALSGREVRPSWSPDGQHIAFLHWQKPALTTPPWESKDAGQRLRVIPARRERVQQLDATLDLADVPLGWAFSFFGHGQEVPQWSPDSKALLLFDETKATLLPLKGEPRQLQHFPANPTFLHWSTDSSIVYVNNDMLWRAAFSSDSGMVGKPTAVSDDAALYPSVARDGSILYISGDGLRVARSDGRVERLGWPLTYRTPAAPERLFLRGVRVIDGKGTSPSAPRDILVEDGRIARIAAAGKLKAKAGMRVIEADGRTVIPGLIDLHAHLWDDAQLPGLLYYGVTTVREMGTAIGRLAGIRDAIEAGIRPGPRIIFGGFQFWGATGFSGETGQAPADEAGRARAVTLLRAFGADYLKMRQFTGWDAGAKLIEHAHASGMPVSGHIALPLPLIAAGIDGMEHLGPSGIRTNEILYDDVVQLFKAAQLYVVPTIVGYSSVVRLIDEPSILNQPETAPFITPFLRWWALRFPADRRPGYEQFAQVTRLGTKKLHKAGITIAAGSDVPPLPWALHLELEELVNAGLSPMEAINAATGTAARVLGAAEEIGTIERGKVADLVILDADPIHDVRNTRKIWRVIKGGWVFDPEKLRPAESPGTTK